MSKLDDIISDIVSRAATYEHNNDCSVMVTGDWNKYFLPETKQQVKDLVLELIDNTEVFGPLHPQLSIYRNSLNGEIKKL